MLFFKKKPETEFKELIREFCNDCEHDCYECSIYQLQEAMRVAKRVPTWKRKEQIFNCARVYVGSYLVDTNQFTHDSVYGYNILNGNITTRELRPIRVRQNQVDNYKLLKTVILYPMTDEATIVVFSRSHKGERTIKLVKHKIGEPSTIYKMRL